MVNAKARLAGLAAWVDDFTESVATFLQHCPAAAAHVEAGETFSQSNLGSKRRLNLTLECLTVQGTKVKALEMVSQGPLLPVGQDGLPGTFERSAIAAIKCQAVARALRD